MASRLEVGKRALVVDFISNLCHPAPWCSDSAGGLESVHTSLMSQLEGNVVKKLKRCSDQTRCSDDAMGVQGVLDGKVSVALVWCAHVPGSLEGSLGVVLEGKVIDNLLISDDGLDHEGHVRGLTLLYDVDSILLWKLETDSS